MKKQEILEEIKLMFNNVEKPSLTMSDAEQADDWGLKTSRFEESDEFWYDIPYDLIRKVSSTFCFLPPESIIYYLPAYLYWFIDTEWKDDSNSYNHFLYYVSSKECRKNVLKLLSSAQKEVVIASLMFIRDNFSTDELDIEELNEAIENWKK